MTRVLVGTSGFSYPEWCGPFYPKGLRAERMLAYYGERLDAVELNNTFYRTPSPEALAKWADEVPEGFRFAVKASRFLSHALKGDRAEAIAGFARGVGALGARLGPVMLQIPAPVAKDVARLEVLLGQLPAGARFAFDFRHPSWLADDVYAALRAHEAALVVTDDEERAGALVVTADVAYVRLRRDAYGRARLRAWAERLAGCGAAEAYVFFKHEGSTRGPELAVALRAELARVTSPRGARARASRPKRR